MKNQASRLLLSALMTSYACGSAVVQAAFTPLTPLSAPRMVRSTEPYPGGSYEATNLFDNVTKTEYSSNGKGTNTFIEMQFPASVRIGAFRHIDRNDPATVGASELVFTDSDGRVTGTVPVSHVDTRGGQTFVAFPAPISAKNVRWRITRLGRQNLATVGGAELTFFAAGNPEATPSRDRIDAHAVPFLEKHGAAGLQPVKLTVEHAYAEPVDAAIQVSGLDLIPLRLQPGLNTAQIQLPGTAVTMTVPISLEVQGQEVDSTELSQKPVRPLTVYILPHSHTDIGYTEIQTAIEKKQVQNLVDGIAHARRTAHYPEGARFVWNVEVLWAADLYLHRLNEQQRADFFAAVRKGQVVLNGMYLNELTGLCRPEELVQLFRYATQLSRQTGVPIDSAMISDVPGYTWGTVTALAQAGIKYFSTAPNYFDRIGTILREWENKPFWWVGPDEKTKVLVWIPFWGYAMSHVYHEMSPKLVEDFYEGLENRGYPYDVAYARWSGHGDNAIPDPAICEFVRDWNAKYAWPHFIISGTGEAFAALEKRYGDQLPKVRGDWTPYWEDGAGSSALETALNRQSSDRVAQAATVYAMLHPQAYPAAAFDEAWKKVLLYSEHTWGADCSISRPESQKTREQWDIKQGYARQADQQSRHLLDQALASRSAGDSAADQGWIEVLNTASWPRTELVLVSRDLSTQGDRVTDEQGNPMPSQRLSDGQLAFVARDVPPFKTGRFHLQPGQPYSSPSGVKVEGAVLNNGQVRVRLDEKTGGLIELIQDGFNFADTSGGEALNDYLYLPGDDLKDLQKNGTVTIRVGEKGPLVASLIVESDAPGCQKLRREIRLTAGTDYVELLDLVDKKRLEAKSYHAKEGKESVNFAFPFNVPDGDVWLDLPLGTMRVEADQMPSACKNWFTVGRWADVSNRERGITWVTLDAPLVQVGGLTATLLNSQTNPDIWRRKVDRTQKLYSWAMNNHWGTNYRAYQEGPTLFRFILRPHRQPDAAEASRFATGFSQPLLTVRAGSRPSAPPPTPRIEPADVLATGFKPADDGHAYILRLFNASTEAKAARLDWGENRPKAVSMTNTSEEPGTPVTGNVTVPSHGLLTVRVELEP